MLKGNFKQINQFEAFLGEMNKTGLAIANQMALNDGVKAARVNTQKEIDKRLIQRNRFTKSRVLFRPSEKTLIIRDQVAIVGINTPYAEKVEFGGVIVKKGKEGVPIPTGDATGEGEGARPRKKLPRAAHTMKRIQLGRGGKKMTRGQAASAAIKEAAKKGRKHVFLNLPRAKGIYSLKGGKKNPEIRMVHSLEESSVRVPKNPTLKPGVDATIPMMPRFYKKRLLFQLKRLRGKLK